MSQPRIISGKARGIRLQDVPGDITRPITDRVKEAVFNILGSDILDAKFLDLFGGTGSVGIEALSRGASEATLVDLNLAAINVIKANLKATRLESHAIVHQMDAFRFLEFPQARTYEYIYIAPPQYKEMWIKALKMIDQRLDLLTEDGWVMVQIHPVEIAEVQLDNLHEFDRREYGSTLVMFYARNDLT